MQLSTLRLMVALVGATITTAYTQEAPLHAELENGVAAGDVTQRSAVLWARAPQPGLVRFTLRAENERRPRHYYDVVRDPLVPVRLEVHGLTPGTRYRYAAAFRSRRSTGHFVTPHAAGKHGLRFGVSGDSRGDIAPFPSIKNAVDRKLDFFVHLGDTIYADVASPDVPKKQAETIEDYRRKHKEIVSERAGLNAMRDLRRSTAWYATIDDHEVTNDFAGGANPASDPRFKFTNERFINETALFENGLRSFHEYQVLRDERYGDTGDARTAKKRKLYRHVRFGEDAAIFVLDNRSFRDQALPPVTDLSDFQKIFAFLNGSHDPSRTMLGKAQLEELERDLEAAQKAGIVWKFVIVLEPMQNLGVVFAEDRFEGYAAERTRVLSFIRNKAIQNVVFVSADIHGTLVNNLTYEAAPIAPRIPVDAFEVVTGAVAYDAPLGPTLVNIATQLGLLTP